MSTRLETLQVARLAPRLLGDSAALVADFLRSRQADDGGFAGRVEDGDEDRGGDGPGARGPGDLYYTVFGLDALAAVDAAPAKPVRGFLEARGDGEDLDLVHLGCLARAWTACGEDPGPDRRAAWERRLAALRRADGGWAADPGGRRGEVYATFLAIAASQDAGLRIPDPERARSFLEGCADAAGGYAASAEVPVATTPTTAAALDALRQLGGEGRPEAATWLRRRIHPQGGFVAADGAPMPDLLSTAVALHALVGLGESIDDLAEPTLDFVDTLWTARGAFHGHWADDAVDCEYTYYGLLALGHLSVAA